MENEKKTPSPAGEQKKNHNHNRRPHHHRRGYFIEPTGVVDGAPVSAPVSGQAPKENKGGAPQGKDRQNRGGERERKEGAGAPVKNAPAANAPQKEGGSAEGGSKNRNRRRRNRHRGGNSAEARENPPKIQNESTPVPTKEENHSQKKKQASAQNGADRAGRNGRRSSDRLTMTAAQAQAHHSFNDSEYEEIRFPAHEDTITVMPDTDAEKEPSPMVEVVGIRFKSTGKTYYFDPAGKKIRKGEFAIVETARGQEYGEVSMGNTMVKESDTVPPLRPILRVATETDKQHQEANRHKEEEAFRVCAQKIASHGLDMKLIDAQYTFDNSKLLFYFTSSGRVDFRELVKDLASVFRTRIELRQIGIRDEAKLMGGMGLCGRPLCCTLFLSDFGQVSIKMAKEQNLSLNSAKISGICGRLMCCLRYEHEAYEYEIKRTPPVDSLVRTADGNGTVTEINPLVGTVKVRLLATPDTPPKLYRREDVVMLKKKKKDEQESK